MGKISASAFLDAEDEHPVAAAFLDAPDPKPVAADFLDAEDPPQLTPIQQEAIDATRQVIATATGPGSIVAGNQIMDKAAVDVLADGAQVVDAATGPGSIAFGNQVLDERKKRDVETARRAMAAGRPVIMINGEPSVGADLNAEQEENFAGGLIRGIGGAGMRVAEGVARLTGASDTADSLGADVANMDSVLPKQTTAGRIGSGVGGAMALLAGGGLPGALGIAGTQAVAGGYDAAYAESKTAGNSEEIARIDAQQGAFISAVRTVPELAAYWLLGLGAAKIAAPLLPQAGPAVKALIGGAAATAANVTTSTGLRAIHGEPLFTPEGLAMDATFGFLAHGLAVAREAVKSEAKVREMLKDAPTESLRAAAEDPAFRESAPYNPKLIDEELAIRTANELAEAGSPLTAAETLKQGITNEKQSSSTPSNEAASDATTQLREGDANTAANPTGKSAERPAGAGDSQRLPVEPTPSVEPGKVGQPQSTTKPAVAPAGGAPLTEAEAKADAIRKQRIAERERKSLESQLSAAEREAAALYAKVSDPGGEIHYDEWKAAVRRRNALKKEAEDRHREQHKIPEAPERPSASSVEVEAARRTELSKQDEADFPSTVEPGVSHYVFARNKAGKTVQVGGPFESAAAAHAARSSIWDSLSPTMQRDTEGLSYGKRKDSEPTQAAKGTPADEAPESGTRAGDAKGTEITDTGTHEAAEASSQRIADETTIGQPTAVRDAAYEAAIDNARRSMRAGKAPSAKFMRASAREAAGKAAQRQAQSLDAPPEEGGVSLSEQAAPGPAAKNTELYEPLAKAIDTLDEREARLIRAVQMDGKSITEAAAEEGISSQYAGRLIKEALPKLREAMEKQGITKKDYAGGPGAMGPIEALEMLLREHEKTGLKRAVVDTERLARGAEPIPTVARQREESVVREAEDIAEDPAAAPSLVARIVDAGDTAISEMDAALLLVERTRLMNERAQWDERIALGEDVVTGRVRLNEIEVEMDRLDRAQRAAGSTWGRLGHMYQRLMRDDFTLEAMERRARAAKNGPLNEIEQANIKEQAEKIDALQKELEALQSKDSAATESAEAQRIIEATINELGKDYLKKPEYGKKVLDIAKGIVDRWKSEAEAARERLKTTAYFSSGGLSTAELRDLAIIARSYIGEFGLKGAELAARLVQDFGPKIGPHAARIEKEAKKLIGAEKTTETVKKITADGLKPKGVSTEADVLARAKAEAVAEEPLSHQTAYEYVRALIRAGTHGEDPLMKAAHEGLRKVYPEISERDVRRAFSEYGKAKFPSKEAVQMELAEVRRATQLQESIDRLREGLDPLKTGLQREKATQAIREKQKELNELLKKRMGPPSPEKLATRDEAKQTALKNAIDDLDKQLRTGEKPPKGAPAPDSVVTEQLRAELAAMRSKLAEIEEAANPGKTAAEKQIEQLQKIRDRIGEVLAGKRPPNAPKDWTPLSDAAADIKAEILAMQELAAQMRRDAKPKGDPNAAIEKYQLRALEKAIKDYDERIATGQVFERGKKLGPPTEAVARLQAIRDARRAVYKAMREAGKPVRTAEERYNATRIKALEKRSKELEAKIARNDFSKPVKNPPPPKSKETIAAEIKMADLKRKFDEGAHKLAMQNRTAAKKIWDGIKRTRGAFVNIASSFDFSAPRQALAAILRNIGQMAIPLDVARNSSGKIRPVFKNPLTPARQMGVALRDMFKAWATEKMAKEIDHKIRERPNAKSGVDEIAEVEYSELTTDKFTKLEENAHSILDEWAELPIATGNITKTVTTAPVKVFSKGVRMSNRAFITFLNSMRSSLLDELLSANFKDRQPTVKDLKAIGNMVNIATGRGKIDPKLSSYASEVIWSPKLLMSRLQFLAGQPFYKGNARTRLIMAKEYARVIAGGYLLYQVYRLFDEKKEKDRTSSDFGKVVRGKTRIDPWAGFQQVTVLASRFDTAKTKTIAGNSKSVGADKDYGTDGLFFVLAKFGRSKLRPDVGAFVDVVTRTDSMGRKTTLAGTVEKLLVPLPLRDIRAILKDRGFTEGMITEAIGQFGGGISVFDEDAMKANDAQR